MILDLSPFLEKEVEPSEAKVSYDEDSVSIKGSAYRKLRSELFTLTFYNDRGLKLFVSGKTEVSFLSPCDRCLSDVEITIPVSLSEEFDIREDQIFYDEEDGVSPVSENCLDVDYLVKNEILYNWPSKVLCKEDCKGICPVCGKNRNVSPCSCDTFVPDPRMAKFLDVFNESKEV